MPSSCTSYRRPAGTSTTRVSECGTATGAASIGRSREKSVRITVECKRPRRSDRLTPEACMSILARSVFVVALSGLVACGGPERTLVEDAGDDTTDATTNDTGNDV